MNERVRGIDEVVVIKMVTAKKMEFPSQCSYRKYTGKVNTHISSHTYHILWVENAMFQMHFYSGRKAGLPYSFQGA